MSRPLSIIVGVISEIVNVPNPNNFYRTFQQRITVTDHRGHQYRGMRCTGLVGSTIGSTVQFLAEMTVSKKDPTKFLFIRAQDGAIL